MVKLVVCDVDGTLTDGGMYYGPDGEALKRFCTQDGMGLRMLQEAGVEVVWMTGERSPATRARARKLGVNLAEGFDAQGKVSHVLGLIRAEGLHGEDVAYIGDDLNDLPAMEMCGVLGCPHRANSEVYRLVASRVRAYGHICRKSGGHGAVREFCDYLLEHHVQ